MRTFSGPELRRFLAAVDEVLEERVEVVVIGGAAAAIQYGVAVATTDIDTWSVVPPQLEAAVERARRSSGLDVPFGKSGVADGPYELEDRLQRALPGLRHLVVLVPERHDLALMKVIRGYEHDLEAIERMQPPLDLDVLLPRFEEEMTSAVTDLRTLKANFLVLVERLFPDRVAEAALRLRTWDRRWLGPPGRDGGPAR